MTDRTRSDDGRAIHDAPRATRPAGIDPVTARTMAQHGERRLQELDADLAHLKRSRDGWKSRAESLSLELDWTHARVAHLGRPLRVWLTLRGVLLHPRSIVRLPWDLGRALTAAADPIRIPPRPVRPELVRADARAAVQAATIETWLRPAPARALSDLRVAIIADQFLLDGLAPECRLQELHPDRWQAQLEAEPPDILLVGSAWEGNGGAWRYRVASYAHRLSLGLPDLTALTAWCSAHRVPTVFWNTEDPVRTDRFTEAAALFDWIFTVDPGSAEAYLALPLRRAAGVGILGPAVQPRVARTRAGSPGPIAGALLAGVGEPSWPLGRREALASLAAAAAGVDLTVLDPRLGTAPRTYLPGAVRAVRRAGSLEARRPDAYARHSVVLVPAASAGTLPFAALEALACGTPVVMTAHGAAAALGDVIVSTDDPATLRAAVERFIVDPLAGGTARADGLRRAVRAGTFRDRLARVARTTGIAVDAAADRITLALTLDAGADLDRSTAAVEGQERRPDEVVIGTSDWDTGRRLQQRIESACPGLAVALIELPPGLGDAAAERIAAAASGEWLIIRAAEAASDPGLVDRAAAAILAGEPASSASLVSRATLLRAVTEARDGLRGRVTA